jgi:hypothetical protein
MRMAAAHMVLTNFDYYGCSLPCEFIDVSHFIGEGVNVCVTRVVGHTTGMDHSTCSCCYLFHASFQTSVSLPVSAQQSNLLLMACFLRAGHTYADMFVWQGSVTAVLLVFNTVSYKSQQALMLWLDLVI